MNINALLGTISFVLWSSFSVWFYVNNIYEFDNTKEYVSVVKPKETKVIEGPKVTNEVTAVAKEETKTVADAPVEVKKEIIETPKLAYIKITKEFIFDKNFDQVKDKKDLEAFVNEMKSTLADRKVTIEIIGYTCDLGSDQFNQTLGLKRAQSVAKALGKLKIDKNTLIIDSKGEKSPLVPNDSENNRAKNRRVTVLIKSTT